MESCSHKYCSEASLAAGEDPIGTATPVELLVILEVALPWEPEIWKSRGFPAGVFDRVAAAINRGVPIRLLCIAPDAEYSRAGLRRMMVLRRPQGPIARFDREEYLLPEPALLPLIDALIEGRPLTPFAPHQQAVEGVRDLMVCTHGSVDTACARYGVPAYERLRREYAGAVPGLRVWRISHFGGHRFAATVLDLPEMRAWAHLDADAIDLLARREGAPAGLRRFYRGWCGLATPFEQALEREALEQEGWDWLAWEKEGRVLQQSEDGARAEVALHFRKPDGGAGLYQAWVEVGGQVSTVMKTGGAPETVNQYRVAGLVRHST